MKNEEQNKPLQQPLVMGSVADVDARIKAVKAYIEDWLYELSIAEDIGTMIHCEKMINKLKTELDGLSKQHCP